MSVGTRKDTLIIEHQGTALGKAIVRISGKDYLAHFAIRPSTVTIYNVSTTDAAWTAVATGLTDVLSWKLKEKSGASFNYAFAAAPATYMTSNGEALQRDIDISAVYVQRTGATNVDMQLEVWTA